MISLLPDTPQNLLRSENVHPVDWSNPAPAERYNLAVIGINSTAMRFVKRENLGSTVLKFDPYPQGTDIDIVDRCSVPHL
jgi:hypothetical protein